MHSNWDIILVPMRIASVCRWFAMSAICICCFSSASAQPDEDALRDPYAYLSVGAEWVQAELKLSTEQRQRVEVAVAVYRNTTADHFVPLWVRQPDKEGREIQRVTYRMAEAVMTNSATEIANTLTVRQKAKFASLWPRILARIQCPYEVLIIDCNRTHQMIPRSATPAVLEYATREKVRQGRIQLQEDSLQDLSRSGKVSYVQLRSEWQRWEPIFRDRFLSLMSRQEADAWLAGEPTSNKKRFYGATFVRGEPALLAAENGELTLSIEGWNATLLRKGQPTGVRFSHNVWHFIQYYAFSPDGTRVATVAGIAPYSVGRGFTSELRIWNTQTGECLMQAHSHGRFGKVSLPENEFVIFSSDGVVF